ncbi:LANO_0H10418g1_1 [Lachancea nothofagi CBS 11611]|uniref:LANO_0H10418g1_1 n=1 Tax=Lachancea nothofagi CBS 11611 TaxID=1266666 RepID=A0A1G4KM57_9SACH|nr:LANO_0H10418g1_1 [Lachancea nothofagi CBS 11611]
MAKKTSESIDHDQDDRCKELKKIFFRLNTFYTFLMSRKHVVSTFSTLRKPIEKDIKRELTPLDLAKIAYLLPRDIVFKYMDVNQFHTETKEFDFRNGGFQQKANDIFELKPENSNLNDSDTLEDTQILVFEFIDGDMSRKLSRREFKTQVKMPEFSPDAMRKMISQRTKIFESSLKRFLTQQKLKNRDPWEYLESEALSLVPQKKEFVDPIEAMIKSREAQGDSRVVVDAENNMTRLTMPTLLKKLEMSELYNSQIVSHMVLDERSAQFSDLAFDLAPEALAAFEHNTFYSHQAQALNAIHKGENVIITTSTSSGKSLIYQLSAIDQLLKYPQATFMYIFPTKALAQDQKRAFQVLLSRIPQLSHIVVDNYDGDTEEDKRGFIRKNARVIFTNPDMIHVSILPNHPNWRHFLMHLKLVVVDELHMYKGLFGSHVALVLRRLQRLTHGFYNNFDIKFISCSATLKRPIEHMKSIFGIEQVTLINEDGSPRGEKHLVVWNPPLLPQHVRRRENFIHESAKILVQLILENVRTIAFCYVRRVCELLMKEVRTIFQEMNRTDLLNEVMSYRGGYSPSDRRKIEQEMFHGNLRAVISTNALELGIDIGGLDAVLMCGFPLSLANFHQQSGRAGRRNRDSLTLVVASDSPVDQHYVAHPEVLKDGGNESFQELILDFENVLILEGHIQCAAFELPILIDKDQAYFEAKILTKTCEERLHHDSNGYHTHNRFLPWPAKLVSLRGSEEDQYAVVDITNGRNIVIEEVEASRTSFTLYDGGIFVHQGYPYLVKEFNPDERYAKVQRVDVEWTTNQRDFTDVDPQEIEMIRSLEESDVPVFFGKIKTTIIVFGFFKIDKYKRIIDAVETHNPPVIIQSKGLWIDIPPLAIELCKRKILNVAGGIHAAQHAIMGLLPAFIVAGVDEIHTECKAPEKEFAERQTLRKRPARLIFYDSKGGKHGSGLSIKAFEHIDVILEGALKRVEECPCENGCPECVAAAFCKENSLVLSKPASLIILHCILNHPESSFIDNIKDGPEPNMPDIQIETIVPATGHAKFSPDLQIIETKKTEKLSSAPPLAIKKEEN